STLRRQRSGVRIPSGAPVEQTNTRKSVFPVDCDVRFSLSSKELDPHSRTAFERYRSLKVGLDLAVLGCAKPGFEPEWRRLLQRSFAGEELSNDDTARFQEISLPGYQRVGAPRVGFDSAADAWIVEKRHAETPADRATVLREFHGYYVLRLVHCDGVPQYSNGGLYDGVDETSFRGDFLKDCADVLGKDLLDDAWNSKMPEAAVLYGRALLAAADAAEAAGRTLQPRTSFLSRLGLARTTAPKPIVEQL